MAKIPQLNIRFGADTKPLKRGVKQSQGMIAGLTAGITSGFMNAASAVSRFAFTLGVEGVKQAIEDAKAQRILAKQLKTTTKATDKQIASVEDWVSETSLAYGVVDDKLRPSLSRLVRSTKDTTKAQKLLMTALNISAATGKDLDVVTAALGKGFDGNTASLGRLGLGLDSSLLKGKNFGKIWAELDRSFAGFAAGAAATTEGKMARLNILWDEAKEKIGEAMLPALQEVADFLTSPEGQDAINNFAETFGDAARELAENMPEIAGAVGKLVDTASTMDWEAYLGLAKWAVAFQAAKLVPGPPQVKILAAIAAYLGADYMLSDTDPITGQPKGNPKTTWTNEDLNNIYGVNPNAPAYSGTAGLKPGIAGAPTFNFNFNQVTDPSAAAKFVAKTVNQWSGQYWYNGRGTG